MLNAATSPSFSLLLQDVIEASATPGNLFATETQKAMEGLNAPFTDNDSLIAATLDATRISTISRAGLLTNQAFKEELQGYALPGWKDHEALPANIDAQRALGKRLYNIPANFENPMSTIAIGEGSNHIAGAVIDEMRAHNVPFKIAVNDTTFTRTVFKYCDEEALTKLAQDYLERNDKVTHHSVVRPNAMPQSPVPPNKEKDIFYSKLIEPVSKRGLTGQIMFTLTYFPTPKDAEIDGIAYQDYLDLYFAMCDQPDAYVEKANEHLIGKLERASNVRFTNKWGTDVSMSLVDFDGRHFTFANSQTKKNIPGSEVFSAPRRDSINGVIVSKGKFIPKSSNGREIINLTMVFEAGKIVDFSADQGADVFQEFLDRAPNNAYVGELGIGTNPHMKHHVANILLVEKVSSSFHLALGEAYQITNYLGKDVHMNNGNDSLDHWDITTMLGDMYLDDVAIMKEGVYLDPELDVLNRGWNAVPVEERPEQWKNYKGPYRGPEPA